MTLRNTQIRGTKAHLEAWLRLAQLQQENRQRWFELGARNSLEQVTGLGEEIHGVQQADDWAALAAIPMQVFWGRAPLLISQFQALSHTVAASQLAMATGISKTLLHWQKSAAGPTIGTQVFAA